MMFSAVVAVLRFDKAAKERVMDSRLGVVYKESTVIFDKMENSPVNLVGKAKRFVVLNVMFTYTLYKYTQLWYKWGNAK